MLTEPVTFLDYNKIEWAQVKRTRYYCYQRFHYQYPGPIKHLRQRLMAVPFERYGDQRLYGHRLIVDPAPLSGNDRIDRFGNRINEFDLPHVDTSVSFEVFSATERTTPPAAPARLPAKVRKLFLTQTNLTSPDPHIIETAKELKAKARDQIELIELISSWVYRTMKYGSGATDVTTDASQALATGQGLCQDFAHLMIALCREAELPARYVSGHMLGEGGSHAWVEVLLPSHKSAELEVFAIDPTNQRRPNMKYIAVATGRDYNDVAPTSGSYTAPYQGLLTFTKKAGLSFVEYINGEIAGSET